MQSADACTDAIMKTAGMVGGPISGNLHEFADTQPLLKHSAMRICVSLLTWT